VKPTLRRKDVVAVQSRVYTRLPGGGMVSAPAGSRGTIIDFFPHTAEPYEGVSVDVGMVALVTLEGHGSNVVFQVNERALTVLKSVERKRLRSARR
jgi:hypothetical protein